MAEVQIKLSGWHGLVALIVVVGVVLVRLASFGDQMADSALLEALEFELMTDYFPADVAQLQAVVESGDRQAIARAAKSVSSSKILIESVQTSAPLLSFGSGQDVVVKVSYALDDAYGTRESGTRYYLCDRSMIGDSWTIRYETGALRYYLNFF